LTFGTPNAMATGFGLGSTIAATTSVPVVSSFNLTNSIAPAAATQGLSFDASKTGTTTTASTGFPLATTTAAGFSFGTSTTASTGFPLSKTTSVAISTSLTTPSTHTSLGTTTT